MSMSASKIFYKVKAHLLQQGTQSIDEDTSNCRYRGDHGHSCAVGCLMTDDIYDYNFEGDSVHAARIEGALEPIIGTQKAKRSNKLSLLDALQTVHDEYQPDVWESRLNKIQIEFKIA